MRKLLLNIIPENYGPRIRNIEVSNQILSAPQPRPRKVYSIGLRWACTCQFHFLLHVVNFSKRKQKGPLLWK